VLFISSVLSIFSLIDHFVCHSLNYRTLQVLHTKMEDFVMRVVIR